MVTMFVMIKNIKGNDYAYLYECVWEDGKPKNKYIAYLGRAENYKGLSINEILKSKELGSRFDSLEDYGINVYWSEFKGESYEQRIWMSPLEFLSLCNPPTFGESIEKPFGFSKYSIEGIEEKVFKNKEDLYSLRLDVNANTGQVYGHEGRHRAYVCWKKGIKKVPVVIFNVDRDNRTTEKIKSFDFEDLKFEGFSEPIRPYLQVKLEDGLKQIHSLDRTAKDVALGNIEGNWKIELPKEKG